MQIIVALSTPTQVHLGGRISQDWHIKMAEYNISVREMNSWQRPGHGSMVYAVRECRVPLLLRGILGWRGSVARRHERGLRDEVRWCWILRAGMWVWEAPELWRRDRLWCCSTLCVSLKSELNAKNKFCYFYSYHTVQVGRNVLIYSCL